MISIPPFNVTMHGVASPDLLAALHRASFEKCWAAAEFAALLATPGTRVIVASGAARSGTPGDGDALGFILLRHAADEAEILTLAVNAGLRRTGIASRLIEQALDDCTDEGVRHVFLEVADDNIAAINCYRRCGFVDIVRRPGYYGASGRRIDAIVMRCAVADRAGNRPPGAR